jgi:DNA-binding transcriptional LysR family regulator
LSVSFLIDAECYLWAGMVFTKLIYIIWNIDMKNIAGVDLNLMTAFEAMMLDGNVTRAAARIGLAQSSMSNALARLRLLFDDQLFVRTPVGMHPTEKARAIAPLVSSALTALRKAINDAGDFDPATSALTVKIATSDYGEFLVLPKVMQVLRRDAPNMTLVSLPISRSDVANQLDRGDVDIAFNVLPRFPSRIRQEAIMEERFVCIARTDHPDIPNELDLSTFLRLQHALVAPRGTPIGAVDRALAAIGEKRQVVMSVANFISLPFLIAQSDMIAVVAERVAQRLEALIGLTLYPVPIALNGFTMSMAWSAGNEGDAGHKWFRDVMRGAVCPTAA